MRFMLDTDICIYIIRKRPIEVEKRFRALKPFEVGISAITLAELEFGIAKSSRPDRNRDALLGFLAPLEVAAFDDTAALHCGEIRAFLEKEGNPIGSMDLMIASHARSLSIPLVSNNVREFRKVPGLRVENWT
jgi:tRNA(fMet)-specific endonuclease VapC